MKLTDKDGRVVEGTPAEIAEFLALRESKVTPAQERSDEKSARPLDEKAAKTLHDYMREMTEASKKWPNQPLLPYWWNNPAIPLVVPPCTPNPSPFFSEPWVQITCEQATVNGHPFITGLRVTR